MNIHEHMKDRFAYAQYLAEDGAFKMAANVLRKLAKDLDEHKTRCEETLEMSI